ncbi:hypothetical protein Tco_0860593 [Tanacetum coccineum]|uniref:Uncharacterized protein n=1 Tax=Tanacetum coccineum TaxID=301880 RepID=A0ABQ5BFC3_9ASTR
MGEDVMGLSFAADFSEWDDGLGSHFIPLLVFRASYMIISSFSLWVAVSIGSSPAMSFSSVESYFGFLSPLEIAFLCALLQGLKNGSPEIIAHFIGIALLLCIVTVPHLTACPPILALMIIGPSVPSSSPKDGKEIVVSGEKLWVTPWFHCTTLERIFKSRTKKKDKTKQNQARNRKDKVKVQPSEENTT